MNLEFQQMSLNEFLSRNLKLTIPLYQRTYSWNKNAIEKFIRDVRDCFSDRLENNTRNHFLGTFFLLETEDQGYEIIDGQQRLSTFVLLASIAYRDIDTEISNTNHSSNDLEEFRFLHAKFKQLIYSHPSNDLKLQLLTVDRNYFESIVTHGKQSLKKLSAANISGSHKLLTEAWRKIDRFVNEGIRRADVKSRIANFRALLDVIESSLQVVVLIAQKTDDAFGYFQMLNDRGVKLTTGDLLKARTLKEISDSHGNRSAERVSGTWDEILSNSKNNNEQNLKWYYSSLTGARPSTTDLMKQYLDDIFELGGSKNQSIPGSTIELKIDKMQKEIEKINNLRNGDIASIYSKASTWDQERLRSLIVHLDHTNVIPLLLSLSHLDEREFFAAVVMLEKFVFRYKTVGQKHAGKMQEIYYRMSKLVRTDRSNYSLQELQSSLKSLCRANVNDDVFKGLVNDLRYKKGKRVSVLKVFFTMLELYWDYENNKLLSESEIRDLPKSGVIDFNEISIEHIFSQSTAKSTIDLNARQHQIGNLTILDIKKNRKASNKSFEEKMKIYDQSSFEVTKEVLRYSSWNKESIEKRQKILVDRSSEVFNP